MSSDSLSAIISGGAINFTRRGTWRSVGDYFDHDRARNPPHSNTLAAEHALGLPCKEAEWLMHGRPGPAELI